MGSRKGTPEIVYRKAVRDKIPEIIRSKGTTCQVEVLGQEAWAEVLTQKLEEELSEYLGSKEMEELVDLIEVAYAVAEARGSRAEAVDVMRAAKREKSGAFQQRFFLLETQP